MTRVVHVIASLTTGGAERQLEMLMRHCTAESAVIALYDGGPVADAIRADGHVVEVLGMDAWRKPLAWPRLAARLRAYRPDIVHVHLLAAQLWGIPAGRIAGVPVIISSEHSLMSDTIEERPHRAWLQNLYRALEAMTTHTVAVSTTTRDRLVAWGVRPERITVIDNGIDFDGRSFDPVGRIEVRRELQLPPSATVIGLVGRLEGQKRVDRAIRAMAPLLVEDTHLVIAGTGPGRADLEALARELGVSDRVHLLGARADMQAVLSAMDVMLSASHDETFGMAVVEGLANGLPAAYVECPALEEIAEQPSNALAIPRAEGDQELLELRGAVTSLLGRPRQPAPAALAERYDARSAARRMDTLYSRLR